jgi:hypothetical protein
MTNAIIAANASSTDREVLIPSNYTFFMMPVHVAFINDLTFNIEGMVYISDDYVKWPNRTDTKCWDFWTIDDSENLHFKGHGHVDG